MKIDVIVNDGSPIGVNPDELEHKGMGGAELALVSWGEVMASRGHEIRIYNSPRVENGHKLFSGVWYLPTNHFQPEDVRDTLIEFRGPILGRKPENTKKIVGWSCDQYSTGDYRYWYSYLNDMVLISPFHKQDHLVRYGNSAENAKHLDLGVRLWEYKDIPKVKGQCIFCSVPDRGLNYLLDYWPTIKAKYPSLSLVITSDYTLWGVENPGNIEYRLKSVGLQDVHFYGKVKRSELVQLQLESELQLYTCNYDENFCIATAECQVAGAIPITSNVGALATTNFCGIQIGGHPRDGDFIGKYIGAVDTYMAMTEEEKIQAQINCKERARVRFDWNRICAEWEEILK